MRRFLNVLDRILSAIEGVVIGTLTLAALVLGVVQVILRYIFGTGFPWAESTFVLLTAAAMLVAGSRAVRDDKHVRVELLPMMAPKPVQTVLQVIAHLAAGALCVFFVYCGVLYTSFSYDMETTVPELEMPEWLIYALVPVTMSAFVLRYVVRLVRALHEEDVPLHGLGAVVGTESKDNS